MVRQRPMDASPLRDPGNERADLLAKAGSQLETPCHHARVTKSWIQAQTHSSRWPHPRSFQRNYASTAQLPSALSLGLQAGATPSDPFPNEPATGCPCGGTLTSQHLLRDCHRLAEARNDLIPSPATPPDQPAPAAQATPDILYDPQRIPANLLPAEDGTGFCKGDKRWMRHRRP